MHSLRTILLVDDNDDDVFFMKRALKSLEITNPLQIVTDGELAIQYLLGEGPYARREEHPLPSFVFLDLKLPKRPGLEVLQWIRAQPHLCGMVVLVMTSSSEPKDIETASRSGANAYLVKPATAPELVEMIQAVKNFWFRFHHFGKRSAPEQPLS